MSIEELAKAIYDDRVERIATGEGGLVDPQELGARDRAMLEEWSLAQAKRHKTMEKYRDFQTKALEKLRKQVQDLAQAEAQEGINQGLEIQAAMAKAARLRKLMN